MANKYAGGIKAGSTSTEYNVLLLSETDGSALTGKVAADMTATYRRQGATRQTITLSDLAAIDSAYASGGVKEDTGGLYRLDLPNAMVATGADFVMLAISVSGSDVFHERIPLETVGAAEVKVDTAALITAVGLLPTAAAVATAVWAAGTRT
ncbi:MAG TPA: hypothetical protein VJ816_04775, partial [Gemmatimonadales bacterium]|nr:hypothetical protein [Gemmatimonadales bacterium]